jgi:hypothetical protein
LTSSSFIVFLGQVVPLTVRRNWSYTNVGGSTGQASGPGNKTAVWAPAGLADANGLREENRFDSEVNLDAAYASAFFGLTGAIIGGVTSFATTWLTQRAQIRERHQDAIRTTLHDLFGAFISEATRLHADALSHEKDDVANLVQLYALIARMRLSASEPVVTAADQVLRAIVETYLAPNRSLREIRELAEAGKMDFLVEFSTVCRRELDLWSK